MATTGAPAAFKADGLLDEWGAYGKTGPAASTPSFMIVTTGKDSLVVAGRVRHVPARGLWLELATSPPELPPIGNFERGGGINELRCDIDPGSGYSTGVDSDSCQALLAAYRELGARFDALFERQLHLTPNGVSSLRDGQENALTDLAYAWQTREDTVTFELVLPLAALPRISGSDLGYISAALRRANTATPAAQSEPLRSVSLPVPLEFGLDSGALACVSQAGANYIRQPRFAYQPGEPNRVLRMTHAAGSGYTLELNEVPLSTREAVIGPLELRTVQGVSPLLAIFKDGTLADCQDIGVVIGAAERGRGLHVIAYEEFFDESVGLTAAKFRVLEISKDGSSIEDANLEVPPMLYPYTDVGASHSKDLKSLSIGGLYRDEGGVREHVLRWRYDARSNSYKLSERQGRFIPDAER